MPPKSPLTTLLLRFGRTTLLLPVTPSTDLPALLADAWAAIKATADADAGELGARPPTSADDLALWVREGEPGPEECWGRLEDKGKTADKWGLQEADELAVSFRAADGEFPAPVVERPTEEGGIAEA